MKSSSRSLSETNLRYLISIASYRRPRDLKRLLDSLERTAGIAAAEVVVVDNDPNESARSVAEAHAIRPTYLVQAMPGIASARNTGLTMFDSRFHAIVFVDDDEWVDERWFAELTSYAAATGVEVVNGPVLTVIPNDAPTWVAAGGFYQRTPTKTGTSLLSAPTNNTLLLRSAWISAGSPEFDIDFSSTGGSDWDFFWGIRRSGARILHCAEAIVSEDVPEARLTKRWLRRRAIRNGIVNTRVRIKYGEPIVLPMLRGVLRAFFNIGLLLANYLFGRGLQSKPFNAILHEYGKLSALTGYRIHEYKR